MPAHPLLDRISSDPAVCAGRPVVRGTRIWVSRVLNLLAEGRTIEHILDEYPPLTEADVRACIAFGALAAEFQDSDIHSVPKKTA